MRMRPWVLLVWLVTQGETENTSAPWLFRNCILYFRHQRSCSEISKLLDSAHCWKAHTYPCISLSYYLGMEENDPSLKIHSAVRPAPLSSFILLAEKTRIPQSTQFGVNWFSFHQIFLSELRRNPKARSLGAFQMRSKKSHLAKHFV